MIFQHNLLIPNKRNVPTGEQHLYRRHALHRGGLGGVDGKD